jgi:hypothetical protein
LMLRTVTRACSGPVGWVELSRNPSPSHRISRLRWVSRDALNPSYTPYALRVSIDT